MNGHSQDGSDPVASDESGESGDSRPDAIQAVVEEIILLRFQGAACDPEPILARLSSEAERDEARRRLEKFLEIQARMGRLSGEPAAGRTIGDFTLLSELGRGGMGVVFRARQNSLDREVALKLLPGLSALSPTRVRRFLREASALAALQHAHIVPVLTAGEQDGTLFFAMERIIGPSLEQLLLSLQEIPVAERTIEHLRRAGLDECGADQAASTGGYVRLLCALFVQVADALAHAHGCGILHRDVKPSNILVTSDGQAKLVDFGLSQAASAEDLTRSIDLLGTPNYLPPEVIQAGSALATVRSDVYSLGISMYRCLSGQVPFEGSSFSALLEAIEVGDVPRLRSLNERVTADLETICHKAIERDPAHRYPTANALKDDLEAFLEYRPIAARPPGLLRRVTLLCRRNRKTSLAVAVALAIFFVLGLGTAANAWRVRASANQAAEECRQAIERSQIEPARSAFERLTRLAPNDPRRDALRAAITLRESERAVEEALALAEQREGLAARNREIYSELMELMAPVKRVEFIPVENRKRFKRLSSEYERAERAGGQLLDEIARKFANAGTLTAQAGEPEHAPVRRARADHQMLLWREALARNDEFQLEYLAEQVTRFDREQRHAAELQGLGRLVVNGPVGSEAHLFRYLPSTQLDPENWRERWVPVPRLWTEPEGGPTPGASTLQVIEASDPGGPLGLELAPGDLIVSLEGRPCDQGVYVLRVQEGSRAEQAGLQPFDRIVSVNGVEVPDRFAFDLERLRSAEPLQLVLTRAGARIDWELPREGPDGADTELEFSDLERLLLEGVAYRPLNLEVWHAGGLLEISVEPEEWLELRTWLGAFPLLFGEESRLGTLPLADSLDLEPGSYLLVLRQPGQRDLRVPFSIPRGQEVRLNPEFSATDPPPPEDVLWVAPGIVTLGLDRHAYTPDPPGTPTVPGFWMRRGEVTVGEWFEFLKDEAIVKRLAREEAEGRVSLVPREFRAGGPLWTRTAPGRYEPSQQSLDWPIEMISFEDALAYVDWLDREFARTGSPWKPALATRLQYLRAARGADQRAYPWGDFYDPGLCKDGLSRPEPALLRMEPGFRFLGDESPFGIRDLAGSVREWHDEGLGGSNSRVASGASFAQADEDAHRIDTRTSHERNVPKRGIGLRLVVRPRADGVDR